MHFPRLTFLGVEAAFKPPLPLAALFRQVQRFSQTPSLLTVIDIGYHVNYEQTHRLRSGHS